ncbi:helix-turn-helix transcriptional regulator [Streptomyces sp.]|uniref:helix-turn-helix transcriptional regulator n=1 Tax=Streptomyces sp. TaxID=1931 RepID=UPI002F9219A8
MKAVHWVVATLHKARLEDGMTQAEVGDRVGRSDRTIASWEGGASEPGLVQVEAWAATHGLYLTLTPDRPAPAPLAVEAAEVVLRVWTRLMLQTGEARRIRLAAGLSQREAAAAVGVDAKALHRWETGSSRPTPHSAAVYGRFLKALLATLALAPDVLERAS